MKNKWLLVLVLLPSVALAQRDNLFQNPYVDPSSIVDIRNSTKTLQIAVDDNSDRLDDVGVTTPTFTQTNSHPTFVDITISSGIFRDRGNVGAVDISSTAIVGAGWHDHDFSTICGTDATAVILSVFIQHSDPGALLEIAKDGNDNGYNESGMRTQVANIPIQQVVTVGCDSGIIQYKGESADWTTITITLMGWIE